MEQNIHQNDLEALRDIQQAGTPETHAKSVTPFPFGY